MNRFNTSQSNIIIACFFSMKSFFKRILNNITLRKSQFSLFYLQWHDVNGNSWNRSKPQTLNWENIQTCIRITRTSWFCVLFLHVLYLTYYVFQVNQCICYFMGNITKSDGKKQLCLLEAQTNYSWVYKGNIL